MSKDLLDGVNDVLIRTGVLDQAGKLTSLTDEAKQVYIDLALQLWNEQVDQLYSTDIPRPNVLTEATITLVAGDRDYRLRDDLVRLHFPLQDKTNGRYISEYPGGYLRLVNNQVQPDNFEGLPQAAAIRPTDGQLYMDFLPTSAEAGLVYTYRYEKDLALTDAADCFPFSDNVYRAMVAAVSEMWILYRKGRESFHSDVYRQNFGRASRNLRQKPMRHRWTPYQVQDFESDPMNDG